ncbi:transmembrane amino acid transporter protein-domain-containing protein [Hyaloraphidium curvatum]|nr:transmembrane amino acid transporter protein-domain-containing protein [Hyaloraphidium curvatum]
MRRAFLVHRARTEGGRMPAIPTRNFIEFLGLYGHFGLLDPDDVSDYGSGGEEEEELPDVEWRIDELGHRRRRYQSAQGLYGTSPSKTFALLLKAFVGTGILFLPKAFSNGGLTFSLVSMVIMGFVSLYTMLILFWSSQSVNIIGAGYGDVAEVLFGRWMRAFVLGSVAVSQVGFGTAYMIFIAQNVINVLYAAANLCSPLVVLIAAQVVFYIPVIWIRRLGEFALLSLVADVFILTGVGYVCMRALEMIRREGPAWEAGGKGMHLGIGASPATFVGTAIFAYEGISLILPIANAMKDPGKFPLVLALVMLVIGCMMIVVGTLSYIAFGDTVATVIFNAMPRDDPLVPIIQLLYALAIVCSFPLSIYPAVRIFESWIFGTRGGKQSVRVKWLKNLFRTAAVVTMGAIAVFGSSNLDYFVSLVGSMFCTILMFVLPAMFDLKLTKIPWRRAADIGLIAFGVVAFFYITYRNIIEWIEAMKGPPPAPICPK